MHGIKSYDFSNLYWFGSPQTGSGTSYTHMVEVQMTRLAYMLNEAKKRDAAVGGSSVKDEESWSTECAVSASWYAMVPMCTPGYLYGEGAAAFAKQPAQEDA